MRGRRGELGNEGGPPSPDVQESPAEMRHQIYVWHCRIRDLLFAEEERDGVQAHDGRRLVRRRRGNRRDLLELL